MVVLGRWAVASSLLVAAAPDAPKITKDQARAYKEACDHGDVEACEKLGEAIWRGEGVSKDEWAAAALFTKACHGGIMMACFNKGTSLALGQGGPKDEWRAASFFKKACDGGVPIACDQVKAYQWQLSRLDAHRERMQAKLAELGLTNEHDEPPRIIKGTKTPRQPYPAKAAAECIQGTVFLLYVIDTNGRASDIEVLDSVPGLDDAALKFVRETRWTPARKDGSPVPTLVEDAHRVFTDSCSTSPFAP